MTTMQERAFEMICQLPEDKIYYVIEMLEGMEGPFSENVTATKTVGQKAYENLQRLRKCSDQDIDYKAKLRQVLEEKYEGVD